MDGSKARKILGFAPTHPQITIDEVEKIVKGFRA
jgi:hypothetical protein